MLSAKTENRNIGMRLIAKSDNGKFSLKFDKVREGDQVVTYEDFKILLIDKMISARRGILTIDFGGLGVTPRLIIISR